MGISVHGIGNCLSGTKALSFVAVVMAALLTPAQADESKDSYVVFTSPVKGETVTQAPVPPSKVKDTRYCEIFPIYDDKANNRVVNDVYNTYLFNDCPDGQWAQLQEDVKNPDYAKQFGAREVQLNGPRRWMMDKIEAQKGSPFDHKLLTFVPASGDDKQGLLAKQAAQIDGADFGDVQYTEQVVHRWTRWIYHAGSEVYELTDHTNNHTYIMQSFLEDKISLAQMPDVKSRLELPENWTFEARTLKEDYVLITCGYAYVIKDTILNGYQRKADNKCE